MQQRVPSEMPKGMKVKKKSEMGMGMGMQKWHQNGTLCPKGTVPIRRSTVHDVLRAKSLFDFGKKRRRFSLARSDAPDVVTGNGHEVPSIFIFIFIYILYSSFLTLILIINN